MAKAISIDKAKKESQAEHRVKVVDELGRREEVFGAAKSEHEKRIKTLKDEIRGWADADCKPGESIVYEGRKYIAPVAAKKNKRRITSLLNLFALWGKEKFLSLCSVTLENAEKNLTPEQAAGVIVEDANVGERDVKTFARSTPAKAA